MKLKISSSVQKQRIRKDYSRINIVSGNRYHIRRVFNRVSVMFAIIVVMEV
jgi:hypothetical protein